MTAEDRLREALAARIDTVEVSPDALPRIRQRTAARRRAWWPAFGAATAVTAAVVLSVVSCVPDRVPLPKPPGGTAASAAPSIPANPTPVTSAAGPAGAALTVSLPVYYTRNGKLFREYHDLQLAADGDTNRLAAAVTEMLRVGSAADPDYGTPWPAGVRLRAVAVDGKTVTVDLTGVGAAPPDGSAALAAQELVYTVAAAATYTSIKHDDGVRVLVDGAPAATLWGSVDTSRPLRQAAPVDVQAPVWVIEPQQGSVVGKTFTVHLAGIIFEATARVRIRSAGNPAPSGGNLVRDETVQFDQGAPAVGEATLQFTLPPGRYTIEAFFISAKDGSVQAVDDHDFTVG